MPRPNSTQLNSTRSARGACRELLPLFRRGGPGTGTEDLPLVTVPAPSAARLLVLHLHPVDRQWTHTSLTSPAPGRLHCPSTRGSDASHCKVAVLGRPPLQHTAPPAHLGTASTTAKYQDQAHLSGTSRPRQRQRRRRLYQHLTSTSTRPRPVLTTWAVLRWWWCTGGPGLKWSLALPSPPLSQKLHPRGN